MWIIWVIFRKDTDAELELMLFVLLENHSHIGAFLGDWEIYLY